VGRLATFLRLPTFVAEMSPKGCQPKKRLATCTALSTIFVVEPNMEVKEPDMAGSYTYADYMNWWWEERVELIQGKIYKMPPAPRSSHQRVSGELFREIANFLFKKKCKVFSAPFDVRLPHTTKRDNRDIQTVVQPDICVICDPEKIDEKGCIGAPDWIIEILSKQTSEKDLTKKFDVYEESGVKEYWIVHPTDETVLVYVLNKVGKYEGQLKPFVRTQKISPTILPGLVIDLSDVFPD
jgi:Uma2 family endonuclease